MVLTDTQNLASKIESLNDRILIHSLEIVGKEAVDYLQRVPAEEHERACLRAFEVGIFCLERTQTSQDTEFVRRQIQSLLTEVEKAVGVIPDAVQRELVGKIGTHDL